jgi:hypothetical protein
MVKHFHASESLKIIVNGIATVVELGTNGIWGQDSGRHGWCPVTFDEVAHCRDTMTTNALFRMQGIVSHMQLNTRVHKILKIPQNRTAVYVPLLKRRRVRGH